VFKYLELFPAIRYIFFEEKSKKDAASIRAKIKAFIILSISTPGEMTKKEKSSFRMTKNSPACHSEPSEE